MSIRKRLSQRSRQARHLGNCTSAPWPESLLRQRRTICIHATGNHSWRNHRHQGRHRSPTELEEKATIGSKPYAELKYREVKGRRMAYIDEGEGDAIVFQHGQPTSSYLWRNVMPQLEGMGRLIACDLIGMGGQRSSAHRGRIAIAIPNTATICLRSGTRSISATVWCSCWTTGAPYSESIGPDTIVNASRALFTWKLLQRL